MPLAQKKTELIASLSGIRDPQERFAFVIELGKRQPPLPAEFKSDAFRLHGCLAKLWFVPEFRDGKCYFRADADSQVVKAITSILCSLYSGESPDEILDSDPAFLAQVGITQHLSPNRRNALSHVWENIRDFAKQHRGPT